MNNIDRELFISDLIISIDELNSNDFKNIIEKNREELDGDNIKYLLFNVLEKKNPSEECYDFLYNSLVLLGIDKELSDIEVLKFKINSLSFDNRDVQDIVKIKKSLINDMRKKYPNKYDKELAEIELPLANSILDIKRIRELREIIRGE